MGLFNKKYTQLEYDKAVKSAFQRGWVYGQESGIHLQAEFTKEFFSKARFNPNTLVYEITKETHRLLKDRFIKSKPPISADTNNPPQEGTDK